MGINLKTNESDPNKEKIQFGKSLPFVILLLLLILAAYGVILFFQSRVESQIKMEQATLEEKTQEFKDGEAKNILDFQNRISESEKLLGQFSNNLVVLDEIQKAMVQGAFLTGLDYSLENNEIVLNCQANSYEQVSKQILSFKKSDFFSQVESGQTSVSAQEGLISFEVTLTLASQSQ